MRKRTTKRAGIGSAFDSFLKRDGTYDATQGVALRRVRAWQNEKAREERRRAKPVDGESSRDRSAPSNLLDSTKASHTVHAPRIDS